MPPRLRLFCSSLIAGLLLIPALALYREMSGRPDIWWTPLPMALSLADSRDRVEIYARGRQLGTLLDQEQLWIGRAGPRTALDRRPDGRAYPGGGRNPPSLQ